MKKNDVSFSIIIPTYNNERLISSKIDFLLNIQYSDYEIIVVDDGSTDRTPRVLAEKKNKKIKVVSQTNQGVSAARNAGMDIAKGDYIIFLDDDDEIDKSILSVLNLAIHRNDYPDFIRYSGIQQTSDGRKKKIKGLMQGNVLEQILNPKYGFCCYTPLLAIKNNGTIRPFHTNLKHLEDLVFYVENLARGDVAIANIDDLLYYYRLNTHSCTKNIQNLETNIMNLIDVVTTLRRSDQIKTWRHNKLINAIAVSVFFWRIQDAIKVTTINHAEIAKVIVNGLSFFKKAGIRPVFIVQPKAYFRYLYLKMYCCILHRQ